MGDTKSGSSSKGKSKSENSSKGKGPSKEPADNRLEAVNIGQPMRLVYDGMPFEETSGWKCCQVLFFIPFYIICQY